MLRYTTYNLDEGTQKKVTMLLPQSKRSHIISTFIVDRYALPEDLKKLKKAPEKPEIATIALSDNALYKLDDLIKLCNKKGVEISRSAILRDVLKQVIEYYHQNPIEPDKVKKQSVYVEFGTIERLNRYIPERSRNKTIEAFILQEYTPDTSEIYKEVPQDTEQIHISISKTAFDRLDELKTKGVSRAVLFRDVLKQLERKLKAENPRESHLENQLKHLLNEYVDLVGRETAKTNLKKLLGGIGNEIFEPFA